MLSNEIVTERPRRPAFSPRRGLSAWRPCASEGGPEKSGNHQMDAHTRNGRQEWWNVRWEDNDGWWQQQMSLFMGTVDQCNQLRYIVCVLGFDKINTFFRFPRWNDQKAARIFAQTNSILFFDMLAFGGGDFDLRCSVRRSVLFNIWRVFTPSWPWSTIWRENSRTWLVETVYFLENFLTLTAITSKFCGISTHGKRWLAS